MNPRFAGVESRLRLALRAVHPAPEGARERVRTRLAATLSSLYGAGPGVSNDSDSGADRAVRAASGAKTVAGFASSALHGGKIVALALFGGMAGAALLPSFGARKAAQVVYLDRPAVDPAPAVPPALPAPAPLAAAPSAGEPSSARDTNAAPFAKAAAASIPRRPGRASSGLSTFAAERMLLDKARSALVQGEPQRALELLGRHRARFPDGVLAEERDAMRVEALVGESRFGQARAAAEAFRAQNPHSLFLPTVDSAIESLP